MENQEPKMAHTGKKGVGGRTPEIKYSTNSNSSKKGKCSGQLAFKKGKLYLLFLLPKLM